MHSFNNMVRWSGGNPIADVDIINKPEMFYRNSDNVIPGRGNRTLRVSFTLAPPRRKFATRTGFDLASFRILFVLNRLRLRPHLAGAIKPQCNVGHKHAHTWPFLKRSS